MRTWPWLLCAALAGAGTMMLELTAPRAFQPWFGASTFVWTNVIGVILTALAMGYAIGGRLADRPGAERRLSGLLATAGAFATLVPFMTAPVARFLLPEPSALAAVDDAISRTALASLAAAMILLAPPVFLLGACSPHIVKALTDRGQTVGRASGSVFMAGTLGSLVGTFLPTYLLVPLVGSRSTLLIAVGALMGAMLCSLSFSRKIGKQSMFVLVVLVGIQFAVPRRPIRAALPEETLLEEVESRYQYLRYVRAPAQGPDVDGLEERLLRINEGVLEYHSVFLESERLATGAKYYDTLALFPGFFAGRSDVEVLVIGSGAGTTSRLIAGHWPTVVRSVVNVDVDPAVLAFEPEFGVHSSNDGPIRSHAADGRTFLRGVDQRFDIIVLDAYARQIDIPFHLASREFFLLVGEHLKPGGLVASNVSVVDAEDGLVQSLARTMVAADLMPPVLTPVEGYPNVILWSGNRSLPTFEGLIAPAELAHSQRTAARLSMPLRISANALVLSDDFAPVEYPRRLRIRDTR